MISQDLTPGVRVELRLVREDDLEALAWLHAGDFRDGDVRSLLRGEA